MDRNLPGPEFRLKPKHALYLIDLAVAAVLFVVTGNLFMQHRGVAVLEGKKQQQAAVEAEGERLVVQADSVMAAAQERLAMMRADSLRKVEELEQKRLALESGFADRQQLAQSIFRLSDAVLNFRNMSQEAAQKAGDYEKDVAERGEEIKTLSSQAEDTEQRLAQTQQEREAAAAELARAREVRTYEPIGIFPDRSGVGVKSEIGEKDHMTQVELQRSVLNRKGFDLGLALGLGLGTGDLSASKRLGMVFTRPLIHRRLGLDLGAGYSLLTNEAGDNNSGVYASAGLRLSPFYKERFHLGLGVRAANGEVLPYIGLALGRR